MALYAIGDLHMTFTSDKKMEVFDPIWKEHDVKIKESFNKIIKPEDTVVLTGDHTWGGHLSTCMEDLLWISELPGKKIMLRGNHDIFWGAQKTNRLNKEFDGKLFFLQNNFYQYGEYALVGSKGYCYEPWDKNENALKNAEKRYATELKRVKTGLNKAKEAGFSKFILFLHYPPTEIESSNTSYGGRYESCFTRIAKEYGVEKVIYSHLHGKERFNDSLIGYVDGIDYMLVSADYLNFVPQFVMD